ncbi:MAG: FAD binding domain-containing protein [Planctomycetota bacterium]
MLRLPKFQVVTPKTVEAAVAVLAEHGERAIVVAGGTDLVPNMKHELFTPDVVVSLASIEALHGIRRDAEGGLRIGAMTPLDEVARNPEVTASAPALAQAASLIAGPQLRRMGTLGGNVMLDTRCQWYNQTYFWRQALGFCLKKDGTVCHVVAGGKKCVAAASNDSAPALMTLDATLAFAGPDGTREVPIDAIWHTDGIWNKKVARGEILTEIHIPARATEHRGAYGKLRDRGSIDFPLLGVAVRIDLGPSGQVEDADVVLVALQARPIRVKKAAEILRGSTPGSEAFEDAARECAAAAEKQCRPMPNVPGDPDYRHRMVPVYVRRTVVAAGSSSGPIHHV